MQYARNLTSAAERGDSAEVSWLLSKEPADFSELQTEAFHCALFAGVICGHHNAVETILQHRNPEKAALLLPNCTQLVTVRGPLLRSEQILGSNQPGEPVSFLALAYGWEEHARLYPMTQEEGDLRQGIYRRLYGPQYLGLMQLLLEYGVRPASAIEGLLQKLVYTLDMAAVAILQARQLEIGDCQLSDGRTLLHLLVSSRAYKTYQCDGVGYGLHTKVTAAWPAAWPSPQQLQENAARPPNEIAVKGWQDKAAPLLQLLLASPSATFRHDSNNKTAMDICLPEYKQFMSAMDSARLLAQLMHKGNSSPEQRPCVVCMDRRPSVVIIPCGHLCVCQPCSSRLQQQCPVCRGAATQMVQTYSP